MEMCVGGSRWCGSGGRCGEWRVEVGGGGGGVGVGVGVEVKKGKERRALKWRKPPTSAKTTPNSASCVTSAQFQFKSCMSPPPHPLLFQPP